MSFDSERVEKLENNLRELENIIINKRHELISVLGQSKHDIYNLETAYNDLCVKQKALADSGDIKNLVEIDRQNCEEIKTLVTQIEHDEAILINLENEKSKLNKQQDKPGAPEKSQLAKNITGIEWMLEGKKVEGYIKNKHNFYLKYFSIKDTDPANITEQLFKEIKKAASSNWDDIVNEA